MISTDRYGQQQRGQLSSWWQRKDSKDLWISFIRLLTRPQLGSVLRLWSASKKSRRFDWLSEGRCLEAGESLESGSRSGRDVRKGSCFGLKVVNNQEVWGLSLANRRILVFRCSRSDEMWKQGIRRIIRKQKNSEWIEQRNIFTWKHPNCAFSFVLIFLAS